MDFSPRVQALNTTVSSSQTMASPVSYQSSVRSAGAEPSASSGFTPAYSRKDSSGSKSSTGTTVSNESINGPSRRATVPMVNRYTHCGRHSDQYLFGGWGDLVKGVFHKRH